MYPPRTREEWNALIAIRLRGLMASRGYSFQKLATAIGKTKGAVQMWVQGDRTIDIPNAVTIAGVFSVTPAYILCLDQPDAPTLTDAEQRLITGLRKLRREHQEEVLATVEGLAKIRSIGAASEADAVINRATAVSKRFLNKKKPNAATGLVARRKSRAGGGNRD